MTVRRESRRAFTLVEVLVTVAIIAIAGAIVVPQMIKTGTLTIQAAGRLIIADLLFAQNEAIAHQEPRRVVFDTVNNRYWLAKDDGSVVGVNWKGGGAGGGNYLIDFKNDTRFAGVTIDAVDLGGDATVEYDALGGPDTGGTIDVTFDNVRYRITISPMTGRVTIEPVTS